MRLGKFVRQGAVAALAFAAVVQAVQAEEVRSRPTNAKWKNECGSCHVAFPPNLLHAETWRALMAGLDKHFGSNAGLDAETAKEISTFLEQHARTRGKPPAGQPVLRITETPWFKAEHREVEERHWKSPKVKSPANCGACHPQAENGDFSERHVKIPK